MRELIKSGLLWAGCLTVSVVLVVIGGLFLLTWAARDSVPAGWW